MHISTRALSNPNTFEQPLYNALLTSVDARFRPQFSHVLNDRCTTWQTTVLSDEIITCQIKHMQQQSIKLCIMSMLSQRNRTMLNTGCVRNNEWFSMTFQTLSMCIFQDFPVPFNGMDFEQVRLSSTYAYESPWYPTMICFERQM